MSSNPQSCRHSLIHRCHSGPIPAFIPTSEGGKLRGVIENPSMAGLCLTYRTRGSKVQQSQRATVYQPAGESCFVTAKPALKILPLFSPVDVELGITLLGTRYKNHGGYTVQLFKLEVSTIQQGYFTRRLRRLGV